MIHAAKKAKPGHWNCPGFARSKCSQVAPSPYCTRLALATNCYALSALASDGEGSFPALLRGGAE